MKKRWSNDKIKPPLKEKGLKLCELVNYLVKDGLWETEVEKQPLWRVICMSRKGREELDSVSKVKLMLERC